MARVCVILLRLRRVLSQVLLHGLGCNPAALVHHLHLQEDHGKVTWLLPRFRSERGNGPKLPVCLDVWGNPHYDVMQIRLQASCRTL